VPSTGDRGRAPRSLAERELPGAPRRSGSIATSAPACDVDVQRAVGAERRRAGDRAAELDLPDARSAPCAAPVRRCGRGAGARRRSSRRAVGPTTGTAARPGSATARCRPRRRGLGAHRAVVDARAGAQTREPLQSVSLPHGPGAAARPAHAVESNAESAASMKLRGEHHRGLNVWAVSTPRMWGEGFREKTLTPWRDRSRIARRASRSSGGSLRGSRDLDRGTCGCRGRRAGRW
jgi:hypothetical protein